MTAGSDVKLPQVGPAMSFRLQWSAWLRGYRYTVSARSETAVVINHALGYKADIIMQCVLRNERKSTICQDKTYHYYN